MTKRFCDICDRPLQPEDDKPFIRDNVDKKVRISLLVTDMNNQAQPDVCNDCKKLIVIDGTPPPELQTPAPNLNPPPPSEKKEQGPPSISPPPAVFEPSLPKPATPTTKT